MLVLQLCYVIFFCFISDRTPRWQGRIYWGVCLGDVRAASPSLTAPLPSPPPASCIRVMVSGSEKKYFRDCFHTDGDDDYSFESYPASGAGYKMLCVARGLAGVYASSSASTYRWDSCAGHALLLALGGDVLEYAGSVDSSNNGESDQRRVD